MNESDNATSTGKSGSKDKKMARALGLPDVFAIASGAMISSGLFVLPGLAFNMSGPAMILAYAIAALFVVPSMLAKAELCTAMPKAGGSYFYAERSLGPAVGIFAGFSNWFSITLKSAFALVGIGAFAVLVFPDITMMQTRLIAVAACSIFTIINFLSVKETGRWQVILVFILLLLLLIFVSRGFIATEPRRYVPFMTEGIQPVFATAGLVFIAYGGLTTVVSVAEEVKEPDKTLPWGMFLSFGVVSFLYIMAVAVTIGVLPAEQLAGNLTPLSHAARTFLGAPGMIALSVAAILAFITTANSGILSASRQPLAMGRDRLIPGFFSVINKRFRTPHISIGITSTFMIASILFLDLEDLVKIASTLQIILCMIDCIAVVMMRESKISNYRPRFKMPLYPWLPGMAVLIYGFILVEMGALSLIVTACFFALGWAFYFGYSKRHVQRKSAFLHVYERIKSKESDSRTLETELRNIIIERDEIILDRFDRAIQRCVVLDFDKAPSMEKLFMEIAEKLAEKTGREPEELCKAFLRREGESCTMIREGLAIPHVLVEGESIFEVSLVRIREGFRFSEADAPVYMMFVLVGSRDMRIHHLRSLMAIAQVAEEKGFDQRWLSATDPESLKDIVLLAKRHRLNSDSEK